MGLLFRDGVFAMVYFIFKLFVTSLLIVLISELSKRSTFVGALLASVPIISVLAIMWLYLDTKDTTKVSALAGSIFWLVLPSLVFFVTLPLLLKAGLDFYASMATSIIATALCYWAIVTFLGKMGFRL
jgi:hypothetical protein